MQLTSKQYRTLSSKRKQKKEKKLSHQVAQFLKTAYPKVIHRFDVAADLKMSMYQAKEIRDGLLHEKGYPDLFIAKPKGKYHGLYIELKKDYSEVFKKDGSYKKNDHLETQICMHKRLREEGYCVEWGLGFEDTVRKINDYMNIGKPKENEKQGELF